MKQKTVKSERCFEIIDHNQLIWIRKKGEFKGKIKFKILESSKLFHSYWSKIQLFSLFLQNKKMKRAK